MGAKDAVYAESWCHGCGFGYGHSPNCPSERKYSMEEIKRAMIESIAEEGTAPNDEDEYNWMRFVRRLALNRYPGNYLDFIMDPKLELRNP